MFLPQKKKQCKNIVRNSPRQSANAENFAEAYLHFIVFAEAVKCLRNLKKKLVFLEIKKKFFVKKKKISFIKKNFFTRDKLFMCIYNSVFIYSFRIFLTHCSSALNRSSFPETLCCPETNVMHWTRLLT